MVTEANRGLGHEACRQLGRLGYSVVLTARHKSSGEAAAEKLREEDLDVRFHPLDVTDEKSIRALTAFLEREFGHLDVLINNAGISISGLTTSVLDEDVETVRKTMETNTLGPLSIIQKLAPLMQGEGRIVNVSSHMGQLSDMGNKAVAYRISKTALNVVTQLTAIAVEGTNVKVNSVCPGGVRTDMGGSNAPRSLEQGAETVIWLATLPNDGPSGGFFRDKKSIPW